MERIANDLALLLLAVTPLLVLVKLVHGLTRRRATFAPRGSRRARVEPVAWLLLAAVDSHTAALWSTIAHQAEDLCGRYRPDLGDDVHLSGGYFFEFPVDVRCVWRSGETAAVTTWPLDALTEVFVLAAVAVPVIARVRRSRRHGARPTSDQSRPHGESTP